MEKILSKYFGDPQHKDIATYIERGGYKALRAALARQPDDLIDEVPLLINLDRKDPAIFPIVSVLANRALEAFVQQADAILEDVRESDQQR